MTCVTNSRNLPATFFRTRVRIREIPAMELGVSYYTTALLKLLHHCVSHQALVQGIITEYLFTITGLALLMSALKGLSVMVRSLY